MDSGDENESSSIKLREYAKKSIGSLKQPDGKIQNVPDFDEEPKRLKKVHEEIVKIEKCFGTDRRAFSLRLAFKLTNLNFSLDLHHLS